MAAFAWKVSCGRPGRRLLLKSPSHTGKAAELVRLFAGRVRFVHIARDPGEVVRSNVAMHARLEGQSLQALPGPDATREAVIAEYVEAEERFAADAARFAREGGPPRVVRLRYAEFAADPMAGLERVCGVFDLRWDDRVRARAARYLAAVGDHAPRRHPGRGEADDPRLAALSETLRLPRRSEGPADRAPDEAGDGRARPAEPGARRWLGVLAVWVSGGAGLAVWLGLAHLTHRRLDVLAWPLGGAVGAAALRVAGRGDWKLGVWAAVGAFALVAASVWPLPEVASGWTGNDRLRNLSTAYGTFNNNYLYLLFGMLTAYRYASRKFARPPGM